MIKGDVVFQVVFILFISVITYSCMGMKKGASKGEGNLYEEFFINDTTTQYFIKPLTFLGSEELQADFTFRKRGDSFSEVVVNYSILSSEKKNFDSILVVLKNTPILLKNVKLIFKESSKKHYEYRYTSTLEYKHLRNLFSESNPDFLVDKSSHNLDRKSKKAHSILNERLFGFALED